MIHPYYINILIITTDKDIYWILDLKISYCQCPLFSYTTVKAHFILRCVNKLRKDKCIKTLFELDMVFIECKL